MLFVSRDMISLRVQKWNEKAKKMKMKNNRRKY